MTASLPQEKESIKVGFISELTGAWSYLGRSCVQGMQIAQRNINASGGVLGRPLEYIVVDDQTNPAVALAAARRLDTEDKVVALSGSIFSDGILAVYGYTEENKLPFIVTAGTAQVTRPGSRYAFRLYPDTVGWGYAVAKAIEKEKPNAKIALLYSDYAVMRSIAAGILWEAKHSSLNVSADVVFPQNSADATVQAARVVADNPDYIVVLGAGSFDSTLTTQLLDLGVKPQQIFHPYGTTNIIAGWTPRSVGSLYTTPFDVYMNDITPVGKKFIEDYSKEVGRLPGYTEYFCSLQAFVLKAAIEQAGSTDRERVRDALSALKMKDGITGQTVEFDANGARKSSLAVMQVEQVNKQDYTAKMLFDVKWSPDVLPVYELAK
jgi:branched-chain amino acid transport system substrate-binding protein